VGIEARVRSAIAGRPQWLHFARKFRFISRIAQVRCYLCLRRGLRPLRIYLVLLTRAVVNQTLGGPCAAGMILCLPRLLSASELVKPASVE
jgi:hypothetical protein